MNNSLPRSLHVIGGKGLGGVERFCIRLVSALHQRGAPVAAVVVKGGEIDRALPEAIPRFHAPMANLLDLYSRFRIRRAIGTFQPDVVQTYMNRAAALTSVPAGRHAALVARPGGYYKARHYMRYHGVVVTTRDIKRYFETQGIRPQACHVIPNFVDLPPRHAAAALESRRSALGIAQHDNVVLGLGRLHPNKGWNDLLDAFARLPAEQSGRRLWLLMVGDGPSKQALVEQAHALGIATRVQWLGWQNEPSLYYQLADVFVCASVHEPFGNVILESWSNRTLLVATRAEGPQELVEDGVDGLLAPLRDPEALAGVLHRAVTIEPPRRAAMIEAGWTKLLAGFSEDAIVSAYLALYADLATAAA